MHYQKLLKFNRIQESFTLTYLQVSIWILCELHYNQYSVNRIVIIKVINFVEVIKNYIKSSLKFDVYIKL